MIFQCENPNIGIPNDSNHIFFSFDHIGAVGRNKRFLRVAINQFCEFIFNEYRWCDRITACVTMQSVKNLILKCGFVRFFNINEKEVFIKWAT